MTKILIPFLIAICMAGKANGQFSRQAMDSINRLSFQDHALMMQQLGITQFRPGPSGDPSAPNAANTDESKATTYSMLPDPLVFDNGNKVQTKKDWEKRKSELMEHFDREVYGRFPKDIPGVTWKTISVKDTSFGSFPVRIRELSGVVDNSTFPELDVAIRLILGTPLQPSKPVPVIMEFGFDFPAAFMRRMQQDSKEPSWQEQLLAQGWGYAILVPVSFQADNGAGLRQGIIGLANKGQSRKFDDWGTLKAWAWGASRALDYFESDQAVDASRIGIAGLSRYGKAALVAMAYEPRLAIGFIGSSGAGGAKLLRRNLGEQVENLASPAEYHWFAGNFIRYAGPLTPNDLPVDAHQLIALCAPRPVFISCGAPGVEGRWIDQMGMFMAATHAGPVYQLLGKEGLGASVYPDEGVSLDRGEIAFRQHEGGHTLGPNWPWFIRYAARYFNR
ncbi:hypothetical protein BA6E_124161 [Bacteroidales bacterium 6E]|nr:hypothetical protein BA6E_124161 [Bacteroidales bacterium 6E]